MENKSIKLLREKAKSLNASVWLGKKGLSDSQILEIKKQLKIRRLIKVKLLKSVSLGVDRKEFAGLLAEKTSSQLIDVVGSVVVLNYVVQSETKTNSFKIANQQKN